MSSTIPVTVAQTAARTKKSSQKMARIGVPLAIVGVVILLVVPLPTVMLDVLLAGNLVLSIVILLTALTVSKPLEFSIFPALLLITTLARLSLNVSTTRLILLHGDAGHVVEAFGNFVIGGNMIVGFVVFLILVVIQFAVITAGASRVSEVAARFTLDAMPGKQMAIDADLNSGLINEDQARSRRAEIAEEADFYGAMDGASKFVKGDAIAAVVMVVINLIAGFLVGVVQQGMSMGEAIQRFTLLSIGDGLVSQIPALLISVSSGILVTRVISTEKDGATGIGNDLFEQMLGSRSVLWSAAGVALALGFLPGLPFLPFAAMGIGMGIAGWRAGSYVAPVTRADRAAEAAENAEPVRVDEIADIVAQMAPDPLRLELASDLLDLVDPDRGNNLVEKVKGLRRQVAADLGVVVPSIRTADSELLPPSTYVVKVFGVEVARGELPPGCDLVLKDATTGAIPGRETVDPVFNIPAVWVTSSLADSYRASGASVIDRGTVLVTHLGEIVRKQAHELFTRQDLRRLLDALAGTAPGVVSEFDDAAALTDLHEVVRSLLAEGVPVRQLERVAEAVSAARRTGRGFEQIVESARAALAATICAKVAPSGMMRAITFDPSLEAALVESVRPGDSGTWLSIDPPTMARLLEGASAAVAAAESAGETAVVVCSPNIRPAVHRLFVTGRPDLPVISYSELVRSAQVDVVGEIRLADEVGVA